MWVPKDGDVALFYVFKEFVIASGYLELEFIVIDQALGVRNTKPPHSGTVKVRAAFVFIVGFILRFDNFFK